jgi:hypothetical protein
MASVKSQITSLPCRVILFCSLLSLSTPLYACDLGKTAQTPLPAISELKPYHASYELYRDGKEVGTAKRELSKLSDNRWQLSMSVEASMMMLSFEYHQQSEFTVEQDRYAAGVTLKPINFMQKDLNSFKSPRVQKQTFDWEYQQELGSYKGKSWQVRLESGTLDRLTSLQQLQQDLANSESIKLENYFRYPVSYKGKVDLELYKLLALETLTLKSGSSYQTLKVEKLHDNDKRKTYLWLSPKQGYLPIRIQQFKDDEEQADMQLKSLSL